MKTHNAERKAATKARKKTLQGVRYAVNGTLVNSPPRPTKKERRAGGLSLAKWKETRTQKLANESFGSKLRRQRAES